jgi:predicted dehydrogenase
MKKLRIGVVGCGTIADIYIKNLRDLFVGVEVAALADLDPARALSKAEELGVGRPMSTEALLADPGVDAVLNLTVPLVHAEISRRALEAGKHLYSEKPLGVELAEGEAILELARAKGLYVGCAPDTFLGGGLQAVVALIDSGAIGDIVGASAFMMGSGPEAWHKDPAFFFKRGGGPVLDMGPYYFTALIAALGPAKAVTGAARASFPRRVVGSGPKKGEVIGVEVPTHATGAVEFASGALATYVFTFDVRASTLPRIEIYGSEGSLAVPDPNFFDGPVLVRRGDEAEWRKADVGGPFTGNSRGLGLAEMASAIAAGRPNRASGELALHALEMMRAAEESALLGRKVELRTRARRPEPLGEVEAISLRKS